MSSMYELRRPMLAVMDPDMLKLILVKECFTYFTNRRVRTHRITQNTRQNTEDCRTKDSKLILHALFSYDNHDTAQVFSFLSFYSPGHTPVTLFPSYFL